MLELLTKSKEVLGMNARNLKYIRPYNLKSAKRVADNKLLCKRKLRKAGIPVSKLIAKIKTKEDLNNFDFSSLPNSFVLKPNMGFGGEGIVVVYGKKKKEHNIWVKADRTPVTEYDLRVHIQNILDGTFSRTGTPDTAFFEERIKLSKIFKPYSFKGVPDIRVIVFNRVPVMAMLRLSTEASGGTSNIHQGGIGVGVDMATGVTTTAVQFGRQIENLPQKRLPLKGIKIPHWEEILKFAIKAQDVSRVGFLGADIAIDRDRGPVFMELNARPGLEIQNANQSGLLARLKRVTGLKIKKIARGIALAQNLFGGEIEEELEEISGKRVIGTKEKVILIGRNKKEISVVAKIDTGAYTTSIDTGLARELGFSETLDKFEEILSGIKNIEEMKKKEREESFSNISGLTETVMVRSSHGSTYRPIIKINLVMDGIRIPTRVTIIDRGHLRYPILIGRRNLKKFLIEV